MAAIAIAIAAYLGAGDAFDKAVLDYADQYADQDEQDYALLERAAEMAGLPSRPGYDTGRTGGMAAAAEVKPDRKAVARERRREAGELYRRIKARPGHLPEHLSLFAVQRLGPETRAWAAKQGLKAGTPEREAAIEQLRHDAVIFARVNGAMSGTPLFIALVPAYVSVLWQQARMTLRIAAVCGFDPAASARVAELLVISGAFPDVDAATGGLSRLMAPARSEQEAKRGVVGGSKAWFELVRQVLILAGFIDPPDEDDKTDEQSPVRRYLGYAIGIGTWALTWIVPVTFMLMMAFSCESRTKKIFDNAIHRYDRGEADRWRDSMKRWKSKQPLRALLLGVTVAIPLALAAYTAQTASSGLKPVHLIAAMAAVTMVLFLAGLVRRR